MVDDWSSLFCFMWNLIALRIKKHRPREPKWLYPFTDPEGVPQARISSLFSAREFCFCTALRGAGPKGVPQARFARV